MCVSVDADRRTTALVADPGSDQATAVAHHRHGMAALSRLSRRTFDGATRARATEVCRALLPTDVGAYPELAVGTVWLGVPLQDDGLGVYLNGAWGGALARWNRVTRWLTEEGVPSEAWTTPIAALCGHAHVSSLAVDIDRSGRSRLKVYFRLDRPIPLTAFGAGLWSSSLLAAFLDEVAGNRWLPRSGLVFCMSFAAGRSRLTDVKVDVCGHCMGEDTDWPQCLDRVAAIAGTARVPWVPWELGRSTEVAFLGMGCRADGSTRWNLYLRSGR
ncbi:hypothetical protein [Nocardioides endophyticus]|uniref:hypothetical protein n=1 Tax=Nocardioides endophyticus TaxID=1353775 RepID=UPI0031ED03B6